MVFGQILRYKKRKDTKIALNLIVAKVFLQYVNYNIVKKKLI